MFTLKEVETVCSSRTLVTTSNTTQCNDPEDYNVRKSDDHIGQTLVGSVQQFAGKMVLEPSYKVCMAF
jgi:hypothetical protein